MNSRLAQILMSAGLLGGMAGNSGGSEGSTESFRGFGISPKSYGSYLQSSRRHNIRRAKLKRQSKNH